LLCRKIFGANVENHKNFWNEKSPGQKKLALKENKRESSGRKQKYRKNFRDEPDFVRENCHDWFEWAVEYLEKFVDADRKIRADTARSKNRNLNCPGYPMGSVY